MNIYDSKDLLNRAFNIIKVLFFILFVGPWTIMSIAFIGVHAYSNTEHGINYFAERKIEHMADENSVKKASNCIAVMYRDSIFLSALYWLLLLSPFSQKLDILEAKIKAKIRCFKKRPA